MRCLKLVFLLFYLVPGFVLADTSLEAWVGQWNGSCQLAGYNSGSKAQKLSMSLNIQKVDEDKYKYVIQYEGEISRNYELVRQSDIDGHWLLDEKSGILIDRFLVGLEMHDLFIVNNRVFQTRDVLDGNTIRIFNASYWLGVERKSGFADGSNQVRSFGLRDVTNCELVRQ